MSKRDVSGWCDRDNISRIVAFKTYPTVMSRPGIVLFMLFIRMSCINVCLHPIGCNFIDALASVYKKILESGRVRLLRNWRCTSNAVVTTTLRQNIYKRRLTQRFVGLLIVKQSDSLVEVLNLLRNSLRALNEQTVNS